MEKGTIIISSDKLRQLFTYTSKDFHEILAELKVDPYETMKEIMKYYTADLETLENTDAVTKILYFVESAYKLGYIKAACEINELNKTIIKNLTR